MAKEKRPLRLLQENYCILCEGITEYHYCCSIKQKISSNVNLKVVDMQGGGYSNIKREIQKVGQKNYLAVFVIFDGDKAQNSNEKIQLKNLINFCTRRNLKTLLPCFLIINSPNFEYIACLHDSEYNGKDTATYIKKIFGYEDLEKFKSDTAIFDKLNTKTCSYKNMLEKIKTGNKIVWNDYEIKESEKVRKKISISCIHSDFDSVGKKGSNIVELFNILKF